MSAIDRRNASILVVDDTPANLAVLSDLLDEAGFEVWVATSGDVALERVQYALPDLILLDVMMPGIDGFETCKRLKEEATTEGVPVIFMTALADAANKVKGLNLGAVDYITKPFQQEEVLARVKLHLRLRSLTREVESQNQLLEKRVAERTAELQEALQNLQQTQMHLIQSEKLSSLGQLVAGIAHEINNPVNFIYGNLAHADEYVRQILEILYLYQKRYPEPDEAIAAKMEAFDLEFLIDDLPKLLTSMQVGAERIREIVKSLRNFSRMDEAEVKEVDIHSGIESTLTILHYRLKARGDFPEIKAIREYGDLPLVECYPGLLNQVFMNILANAIDAIEERNAQLVKADVKADPGRICISTKVTSENWVAIAISDNGLGMSEEVRAKLFNPFFTTKPVGKGTGLGLAISYSIVVGKHNGRLQCHSQEGQGTEFAIEIPCRQGGVPATGAIAPDKNACSEARL